MSAATLTCNNPNATPHVYTLPEYSRAQKSIPSYGIKMRATVCKPRTPTRFAVPLPRWFFLAKNHAASCQKM